MIEDKPIDYKTEYNKTINKLVSLRQKHDRLKEDYDYIKSLADRYFDEGIKLKKENEQLKNKIDNICREINDKPTMTTTEVMVKLQELLFNMNDFNNTENDDGDVE